MVFFLTICGTVEALNIGANQIWFPKVSTLSIKGTLDHRRIHLRFAVPCGHRQSSFFFFFSLFSSFLLYFLLFFSSFLLFFIFFFFFFNFLPRRRFCCISSIIQYTLTGLVEFRRKLDLVVIVLTVITRQNIE